jgi:hypothetical protein
VPDTVYLYIGTWKTGTTYLQNVLWNNKQTLAADGVLVPGDGALREQAYAVMDLIGVSGSAARPKKTSGAWDRLVRTISAWSGSTVVVSTERLSIAQPHHVRRIVADLAPAEVRVVLTARDLGRTIPASWQERLKNWNSWSWSEFITSITQPPPWNGQPAKGFWAQQDVVGILARWAEAVATERITVVTVPPAGAPRDVLVNRFAQAIGSDAGAWDTAVDRLNESLGAAEAELLRRVNPAIRARISWPAYERHVKLGLARDVLAARPDSRRFALPSEHFDWVLARSQQMVADLQRAGYPVVGDLADLLPVRPADGIPAPDDVTDSEVLAAADDVIVSLVERLAERDKQGRPSARASRAPARAGHVLPGRFGRLRELGRSATQRLRA